ncbi:MAG: TIM barrel protein [Filomicrobium sp.]
MPRFCANISFLFTELPFTARFQAAAEAGFKGVEFLFPYDEPADKLARLAKEAGVEIVLFNIWPGDWDAGSRGLAGIGGNETEFFERLNQALSYARILNCKQLHAMAGLTAHGANEDTFVDNLKSAADIAIRDGVTLLTEPINTKDMPGYLVTKTAQATGIIARVNKPNVGLQFDLYHRHKEEGSVAEAIDEFGNRANHYQIASPPDRGEPDEGELDFKTLITKIDQSGYAGWIGCEYRPRGETTAGLKWLDAYRDPSA